MGLPRKRARLRAAGKHGGAARNRPEGIHGYRGAYLLRRDVGDEVEFSTILLFDSFDALREFAGDDYEKAYVPPRAREVLSRFDETSAHYETLMTPGDG
jgi:hypothetical protein